MPNGAPGRCAAAAREDGVDLLGQAAAVGVAEHEHVRAGVPRGGERRQRVVGIVLVAVEEMLGVVDHLAAVRLEVAHGVGDHRAVLRRLDAEDVRDVQAASFCRRS